MSIIFLQVIFCAIFSTNNLLSDNLKSLVSSEVSKHGLRPTARSLNVTLGVLRSILDGRDIHLSHAEQIIRQLSPSGGIEMLVEADLLTHEKITSDHTHRRVISVDPVDLRGSRTVEIKCPLLKEIIAQLCEEWAAMEPRAKERMYQRFRALFPELTNENMVYQIAWEAVDPPIKQDNDKQGFQPGETDERHA